MIRTHIASRDISACVACFATGRPVKAQPLQQAVAHPHRPEQLQTMLPNQVPLAVLCAQPIDRYSVFCLMHCRFLMHCRHKRNRSRLVPIRVASMARSRFVEQSTTAGMICLPKRQRYRTARRQHHAARYSVWLVRMRVSKQLLSRPDGIRSLLAWQHKKGRSAP